MTDMEKLKAVFGDLGIKYKTNEAALVNGGQNFDGFSYNGSITIGSDNGGIGYPGFIAEFYFVNGKFVGHGEWE